MRDQTLYKTALPFMTQLRDTFSETVALAILDENIPDGIVIGQVQGTQRFSFRMATDKHFPLHTGAPGKAIVAYLPPDRRGHVVKRMVFTQFNERTIASRKTFLTELARIRRRGYSTDVAEEVEGCHCVSAPVLDKNSQPVAAIWVTAPSHRFPVSMFKTIAPVVIDTAKAIARALRNREGTQTAFMRQMVEEAEQYIADHVAENFNMEQMSAELHVGYSSLRHWFKTLHGTSPAQRHMQLRLNAAKERLRSSTKTVAAISHELGYNDQNYFSSLFKKKTGIAPLSCREQSSRQALIRGGCPECRKTSVP